jgi:hypothetical protein
VTSRHWASHAPSNPGLSDVSRAMLLRLFGSNLTKLVYLVIVPACDQVFLKHSSVLKTRKTASERGKSWRCKLGTEVEFHAFCLGTGWDIPASRVSRFMSFCVWYGPARCVLESVASWRWRYRNLSQIDDHQANPVHSRGSFIFCLVNWPHWEPSIKQRHCR